MKMSRPGIALFVLFVAAALVRTAAGVDLYGLPVDFHYFGDVRSSYMSRGKISEDRPVQSNRAELRLKFLGDDFDYGDIGLWHFHFHSLTPRLKDKRWRCFAEVDWGIWYHYNLRVAEDWTLSGRVLPRWFTLPFWHSNPSTMFEWNVLFSLDNPYLTPSLLMRRGMIPGDYLYFQVGVARKWALCEGLSVEPGAYVDISDQCMLRSNFGELPDGGRYGSNFGTVQFRFPFTYRLTENWALVFKIEQMINVNEEARAQISGCGKKEWTLFTVGLDARF